MSKAADAFRTISEVAEELDVPKHVLRFWEAKFPQIRPMKRGGGRRYYRPADMELLRGIRHLLHAEGYTIKGVQKILREQGVDAVKFQAGSGSASVGETSSAKAARRANKGPRALNSGAQQPFEVIPTSLSARRSAASARDEEVLSLIRELETLRDMLRDVVPREAGSSAVRRARAAKS